MSPAEAVEMVAVLAAEFDLPKRTRIDIGTPITGVAAAHYAFADYETSRIYLSRRLPLDEWEFSIVHEVAHLVAHKQYGVRRMGPRRRRDHHGPHFVDSLRQVVRAWYADELRYPWSKEYKTVARRAEAARALSRETV